MRKLQAVVMGLLLVAMLSFAGCGGGGGGATQPNDALVTGATSFIENVPPDLSNSTFSCLLNVLLHYDPSISTDDVDGVDVIAANGWHWVVPSTSCRFDTDSNGKPYVWVRVYYGNNPWTFPIAGTTTMTLRLKDGRSASTQRAFHEPGASVAATHDFVYSAEDSTPWATSWVRALGRFPTAGYTVQYSAGNGGSITTTGLAAVMDGYLAAEPAAYSMYCWFYDASGNYLGRSYTRSELFSHTGTATLTPGGELLITPATTVGATGPVNLAAVKSLRFVYTDGSQYQANPSSGYDYRSISAAVPVN